jgi:outer membrane protein TolC
LSQTFDWSGKRSARSKAAESALASAEYRYSNVRNTIFASALYALGEYDVARQYADLSQQQVTLLQQLLDVTESRFAVGDLGALDVELARLSLSEALYRAAQANSELRLMQGLVESETGQILVNPLPQFLPTQMPGNNTLERLVENIPEVREAQYQFLTARDVVGIAESQRKADPTVSLGSGRDGGDSVIALSLSIPLYIRNRYRAEVSASNEAAIAAELRYVNLRRVKLAELSAASESYSRLSEDLQRWQGITEQRFDESRDLLLLLWESGDITTAEYVFGLQQNVEAVRAGASFNKDVFTALVTWLEASGQTVSWLESISQQTTSQ